MKDIALDAVTGDILVPLRFVEGAECYAQRLRIRFRFFKGDWFLNPQEGVPYLEQILEKGITQAKIDSIFRLIIESTPGTDAILSFTSTFDTAKRIVSVNFSVLFDGTVIALDEVFIL